MNAKTFSRFLLGGLLLGAYYLAPHFLRDGETVAGIHPGRIVEIVLDVPGQDGFHLRRTATGWTIDDRREIRADHGQINSFLDGLGTARLEASEDPPDVDWGTMPELRLIPRRGNDIVLELGPRVRPFHRQLVRTNRRVYELSFDVSASLGLWQGDFAWDGNRILDRIPILIDGEEIVRVHLENRFSDYLLERTDRVVERREDEFGEEEVHYRWTSGGSHADQTPSPAGMYRFTRQLKMLVVDEMVPEGAPQSEVARTVTFTTNQGRTFEVATGIPLPDDSRRMLWVRQPDSSDPYLVDDRFFHRFTPPGAYLFENRPFFATGAARAVRIAYERNGHRLVLEREGGREWRITHPQIPYRIYTPPPEPGAPAESMAEMYVNGIQSIGSEEIFVPDTAERRQLIDGVFDEPAARLIVEGRDGSRSEIVFSEPIAGTGRVFATMGGDIAVFNARITQSLTPDITYFLNPAEVEGRTIEW